MTIFRLALSKATMRFTCFLFKTLFKRLKIEVQPKEDFNFVDLCICTVLRRWFLPEVARNLTVIFIDFSILFEVMECLFYIHKMIASVFCLFVCFFSTSKFFLFYCLLKCYNKINHSYHDEFFSVLSNFQWQVPCQTPGFMEICALPLPLSS